MNEFGDRFVDIEENSLSTDLIPVFIWVAIDSTLHHWESQLIYVRCKELLGCQMQMKLPFSAWQQTLSAVEVRLFLPGASETTSGCCNYCAIFNGCPLAWPGAFDMWHRWTIPVYMSQF